MAPKYQYVIDGCIAGQCAVPDADLLRRESNHGNQLVVTDLDGNEMILGQADKHYGADGMLLSWSYKWLPTGRKLQVMRVTWLALKTHYHGGGQLYRGKSWFAADRACRRFRLSGCTCGCAYVRGIEPVAMRRGQAANRSRLIGATRSDLAPAPAHERRVPCHGTRRSRLPSRRHRERPRLL